MAVVINEFEAVAEPRQERKDESAAAGAAEKIELVRLLPPLRRLVARHARLSAH